MGSRRVRALLALGAVSLVLGIFAIPAGAADGTFMRSPGSGPAGSQVSVASVTPCPVPPPDPGAGKVQDTDVGVSFFFDAGQSTFVDEVDANDATGEWAGQITIPASTPPGTVQLHGFCTRVVSGGGSCSMQDGRELCLPRTDGPVDYFTYAPQSFVVCVAGTASCGTASLPRTDGPLPTTGSTLPPASLPTMPPSTSAPGPAGVTPVTSFGVFAPPDTAPSGTPFSGGVGGTPTPGGAITVSEDGFAPGVPVHAVLYSSPVTLGTLLADATGRAAGTLTLPTSTPAGAHTLALFGGSVVKTTPLTVIGPSTSSSASGVSSTIPRTGPSTEPRALALPALLIAAAGGLWLAAARQYRLAAGG